MESKQIVLPQIEIKSKPNLSPFTWNNLKIPTLNKSQQKPKQIQKPLNKLPKPNQIPLKTIKQKSSERKNNLKLKAQSMKKGQNKERSNSQSQHNSFTQAVDPLLQNHRYRLKSKIQNLNKTLQLGRIDQDKIQHKTQPQAKRIRFLDDKNNMQKYLRTNLTRIGWSATNNHNNTHEGDLLWSNIDKNSDHHILKQGQFYNHLSGSYNLTNKDKLHETAKGKYYYPYSFLIPHEYSQFAQENNKLAFKKMLKTIAKSIQKFINPENQQIELLQITLDQIMKSSIIKHGNEQTNLLFKLCCIMQKYRRQSNYLDYFQKFEGWKPINLNTSQHFYDLLKQTSFLYLDDSKPSYIDFDFNQIDYRLLILILHYHYLFSNSDAAYNEEASLWIIKPIASSRGAGISIVKALSQYCTNPQTMWLQFKNRKKYQNKIIQKYITNPYILQKPKQFANKKFDIRQWVLVTSHHNKPIIYKYHTGYCRFSHQLFTLSKLTKDIHLTNYSIFKTIDDKVTLPSTMMLEDLFTSALGDLRSKYNQQANLIIKDVILACQQIKYQEGCFQLFGFDFLFDASQKLHLLEINLNPACNAQRHPKLKEQSQMMTKTMIALITQYKPTDKWIKLYGSINTLDSTSEIESQSDDLPIRPYYQYKLKDDESLIAFIRIRNRVLNRMFCILQRFIHKKVVDKIKTLNNENNIVEENLHQLIHFIEEKSVSNF